MWDTVRPRRYTSTLSKCGAENKTRAQGEKYLGIVRAPSSASRDVNQRQNNRITANAKWPKFDSGINYKLISLTQLSPPRQLGGSGCQGKTPPSERENTIPLLLLSSSTERRRRLASADRPLRRRPCWTPKDIPTTSCGSYEFFYTFMWTKLFRALGVSHYKLWYMSCYMLWYVLYYMLNYMLRYMLCFMLCDPLCYMLITCTITCSITWSLHVMVHVLLYVMLHVMLRVMLHVILYFNLLYNMLCYRLYYMLICYTICYSYSIC